MSAQKMQVSVRGDVAQGPMAADRQGLGLAGIPREAGTGLLADGIHQARTGVVRLFVQEYYRLYLAGRYDWSSLDAVIDEIRRSGGTPVLSLSMMPLAVYPTIGDLVRSARSGAPQPALRLHRRQRRGDSPGIGVELRRGRSEPGGNWASHVNSGENGR